MHEKEIVEILNKNYHPFDKNHPAFLHFIKCMKNKQYGVEPLCSAWYFFKCGFEQAC